MPRFRFTLVATLVFVVLVVLAAPAVPAFARPAAPRGKGVTFTTPGGARLWYEVRGTGTGDPLVVNDGPGRRPIATPVRSTKC